MTAINSNRAIRGPVTAVPVVAGKGVRLVADTENNRWVVEADETVLWSGTYSGTIGSSNYITLSEDPANFDKIIITNGGGYKSSYQFDGSSNVWSFVQSYANTGGCSLYAIRYSVNHANRKITCLCANFFETYANGVRNWANRTAMDVGELQLTKVVGINRVASA